jgi:hypothetical protein
VDAEEQRARQREVEPHSDQLVERRDGHRAERQARQSLVAYREGELCRLRLLRRQSHRREQPHRLRLETSGAEREHEGGGGVEPLEVVDGDDERALGRESPHSTKEGGRDCALVGRHTARVLEQERNLESAPLRPWQGGEDVVARIAEQVGEPGEGELYLGPSGAG